MPPRSRAARRQEPAEAGVRERILTAAMEILHDAGIQGLSQVQVARRADVRQSHVTYYFPKRHDLIEAVAVAFVERAFGGLEALAAAAGAGDLPGLLARMAAAVADEGHMRIFTAVIVEADNDARLRAILVKVTKHLQATLAGWIGGADASERARVVLAAVWGLGLYDFLMRSKRPSALAPAMLAALAAQPAGARRGARR